MDEMNQNANSADNNPIEGNRTFSQDDVNHIVQERLAKEKQKGQEEYTAREQELVAKEFRLDAVSILREKGLPDELAGMIKADDIKSFGQNVDTILKLIDDKAKAAGEQKPSVVRVGRIIGEVSGPGYTSDSLRDAFGLKK